jgi:hypothetical protein
VLDTVGVVTDKEVKVEEIEASHTLGGTGQGHVRWRRCTCYSTAEQYTKESVKVYGRAEPEEARVLVVGSVCFFLLVQKYKY